MERLIVLGGTFDPIHNGHMQLANKLFDIFQTQITFMPTGIPPYKAPPKATNKQRIDMLKLAIDNNSKFTIDTREITASEYWYSHKTLNHLRKEYGNNLPIYFVIGGDSLITMHTWHFWNELPGLANFVVAKRGGYDISKLESNELSELVNNNSSHDFSDLDKTSGTFYLMDFIPQNISSTLIRKTAKDRQDISGMVPEKVAAYIKEQQLYLE